MASKLATAIWKSIQEDLDPTHGEFDPTDEDLIDTIDRHLAPLLPFMTPEGEVRDFYWTGKVENGGDLNYKKTGEWRHGMLWFPNAEIECATADITESAPLPPDPPTPTPCSPASRGWRREERRMPSKCLVCGIAHDDPICPTCIATVPVDPRDAWIAELDREASRYIALAERISKQADEIMAQKQAAESRAQLAEGRVGELEKVVADAAPYKVMVTSVMDMCRVMKPHMDKAADGQKINPEIETLLDYVNKFRDLRALLDDASRNVMCETFEDPMFQDFLKSLYAALSPSPTQGARDE